MRFKRYLIATTLIAANIFAGAAATAEGWRDKFPQIRLSVLSTENAEGMRKWDKFADYLGEQLKTKIVLRPSVDYAGTVEAFRAKHVEIAVQGGAAYAQTWLATNGNIEPLAEPARNGDQTGYWSTILVKSDSPYRSIDDLKGRSIVFPDPNSTSGFEIPTYYLRKEGKNYEKFFSRSGFAGNHEVAVMAVFNGTYDAVATWYNSPTRNSSSRMSEKGMFPPGSMRSIWLSPKIEEIAFTTRADLPDEFKSELRTALLELPKKHPELLKELGDWDNVVTSSHEKYQSLLDVMKENLMKRKGK